MRLSEQYEVINRFRERHPVDVEGLAYALGVPVHYAFLPESISGMVEPRDGGRFEIVVNANHPRTRQRFTLAHELGHYMLHRHLIGTGVGDDCAYRSTDTGKYRNRRIGPREETQANKFAASVLMPNKLIESLQKSGVNGPSQMAKLLDVSEHAMHIRMDIPYSREEAFS
ncbi:ImmA/IrrE family metallo-endopeptidase [Afifella sp. H1R]|uniref:ImmA/IrrE family metallo-endopeptidase n=1 Tax=Afifella sp. H1R TaxID=2908841 RepID=UPI001F26A021|nr:ImmA/IrrE family metallo-endopeptidase [Afifella sp. H1R]MCF1505639.1 ImmA/IrrE family metallo-endopeptidase [Afifella sp. H1R]